jgi:alpha-soluble NSF attachment protein
LPDPDFIKAVKIYEEVADKYLENKLTEPSAKSLYFKSVLLLLVLEDSVGANISIEKYCNKSPSF